VLTSLPAIASGMSDWVDTDEAEARSGWCTRRQTSLAVVCLTASWLRRRGDRHGGAFWSTLGVTLTTAGGFLGGPLAFALGVGVDTNAFDVGPAEWTAVRGNVPTEDLVALTAGGVRIMMAQNDSGRFALADRCSHRGGPLSEGTLEGACVTCPWHGSQFDLATGELAKGPESIFQPVYETRVVKNKLELRRRERRALRRRAV
jgi:nitrite reductase/ring-hydroxylating ferredoxin subunit